MKKTMLITSLFLPIFAIAATPIDGMYTNVFGGYAYLPNNLSVMHDNIYLSHANYKSGYTVGGRIGYKSNPLRYEGELTFIKADVNRFKLNGFNIHMPGGYSDTGAVMGNIYYDIPEMLPAIEPFVGAGIGYAWTKNQFTGAHPFGPVHYSHSNSNFAWQLTTGLAYHFAENFSLDGAYRYFATNNIDFLGKPVQANLATLGITYRFDSARYK